MPVHINISGDTAAHALKELQGLAAGFSVSVEPPAQPVAEPVPAGEEKTFPEAQRATRKSRAAKAEPVAPNGQPDSPGVPQDYVQAGAITETVAAPAAQPEPEAEQPADDQVFTLDDARKALANLLAQPDGKTKAQAVFAEIGCTKLSELEAGQYKAFIAAIAKARGL